MATKKAATAAVEPPPERPVNDEQPVLPEPEKQVPEEPEPQYPEVWVNNEPYAVMATEAEKAQGIFPKNVPDAPKSEDATDPKLSAN